MRFAGNLKAIVRTARRLRDDQDGNALIYVTIAGVAILGMAGLALDGSRAVITHSEGQAAADAAALAAASQLDGGPTAIARATAAAQTTPLVSNSQKFANGASPGPVVTITGMRFLSNLPLSDDASVSGFVTTDPKLARFVEVTTEQLTHTNTFLKAVSTTNTATVQRTAVAGFRQVYCKIPPLMICNPDETTPGAPFAASARIGAEIKAKSQGGSSAWGPGTFGLLQTSQCTSNSADCLRDAMAAVAPNACFENQANVRPGEAAGPTSTGLNTRFDIYGGGIKQSAENAPDTNITQDFKNCNKDDVKAGAAFPDDTNNPPPKVFGNGHWNCAAYWASNHAQAPPAGCTSSASAPLTRYAVYKLERDAANASKYGKPQCVKPGVEDRRVVYLTVLNCQANGVKSNSTNVPVEALLKAFLLRPVASGSDPDVVFEVIDVARPGIDNEVLKDDVQLYR
jgi:Flp pilus assembly protein TadG